METITTTAINTPALSILVSALQFVDAETGSDLVNSLNSNDDDFTVFAPSNAAFGLLAQDLGFAGDPADLSAVTSFLVTNVPAETLRDVILYHVLDDVKFSTDLAADEAADASLITLNGATLRPDLPTLVDNEPDLIDPSLIDGLIDVEATNGVVHVIDRVLLPIDLPGNDAPSLAGIVAASGDGFDDNGADFDILLAAAGAAGLVETLASEDVDLTVFAPTDDAFVGLATTLGFEATDEAGAFGYIVDALTLLSGGGDPIPLLTDVLLYHVVGESLQSSQIIAEGAVTTVQGGTITLDGLSLQDADPDLPDPSLIATDIQASNGIAHVIDAVLIPANLLQSDGSSDVDFIVGDETAEIIRTGKDNDFVDGNGGTDFIRAGRGDDVALGGDGNDSVGGGRGNDTLSGGEGSDILQGGKGNDLLDGGVGNDIVKGGAGNDILHGGAGRDLLFGGNGADTFVFKQGDGADRIFTFGFGDDVIDLSDFGLAGFEDIAGQISQGDRSLRIDFETGDHLSIVTFGGHVISEEDFLF